MVIHRVSSCSGVYHPPVHRKIEVQRTHPSWLLAASWKQCRSKGWGMVAACCMPDRTSSDRSNMCVEGIALQHVGQHEQEHQTNSTRGARTPFIALKRDATITSVYASCVSVQTTLATQCSALWGEKPCPLDCICFYLGGTQTIRRHKIYPGAQQAECKAIPPVQCAMSRQLSFNGTRTYLRVDARRSLSRWTLGRAARPARSPKTRRNRWQGTAGTRTRARCS